MSMEHGERVATWIHKCTEDSHWYSSGAGQSLEAYPQTVVRVVEDDIDHSICRWEYHWIASVKLAWRHWKPKWWHSRDQIWLDRSLESIPRSFEHVRLDHWSSLSCWVCAAQRGRSMLVSSCDKLRFEIRNVPFPLCPSRMSIGRFVLPNRSTKVNIDAVIEQYARRTMKENRAYLLFIRFLLAVLKL